MALVWLIDCMMELIDELVGVSVRFLIRFEDSHCMESERGARTNETLHLAIELYLGH